MGALAPRRRCSMRQRGTNDVAAIVEEHIFTALVGVVLGSMLIGVVLAPAITRLRDLVSQFSALRIPVAPDKFTSGDAEDLKAVENREIQREEVRKKYNDLYRDYSIRYDEFLPVAKVFILALALLIPFATLGVGSASDPYVATAGAYVLLALIIVYLKPHISPAPRELVSIDYIGQHFTNLHYQSVLELQDITLYWRDMAQRDEVFGFHVRCQIRVTGLKFLFGVTDREDRLAYFISYGALGRDKDFLHVLEPAAEIFATKLGQMDYGRIPGRPDLNFHLWIFAPLPRTWKALTVLHPSVMHDGLVVSHGAMKGFAIDSHLFPFRSADDKIVFNRHVDFWTTDEWSVEVSDDAHPLLLKFARKAVQAKKLWTRTTEQGMALPRTDLGAPSP